MGLKEFLKSVDDTLNKFGDSVSGVVDKMNSGSENLNKSMSGAMDRMGDSLQNTLDNMSKPSNAQSNSDAFASVPPIAPTPPTPPIPPMAPISPESELNYTPQPIKQAVQVGGTDVSTSIVNSVDGGIQVDSTEVSEVKKSIGVSIKKEG